MQTQNLDGKITKMSHRTANSPLVKSIDFCGQWRPTEMSLSGNVLLKREEAVAKGINFDRIVAELIMKMNRMQVGKRVQPKSIHN